MPPSQLLSIDLVYPPPTDPPSPWLLLIGVGTATPGAADVAMDLVREGGGCPARVGPIPSSRFLVALWGARRHTELRLLA